MACKSIDIFFWNYVELNEREYIDVTDVHYAYAILLKYNRESELG